MASTPLFSDVDAVLVLVLLISCSGCVDFYRLCCMLCPCAVCMSPNGRCPRRLVPIVNQSCWSCLFRVQMVRAAVIGRTVAAFIAVACVGRALSQFATCDDEYECVYEAATSDGFTFKFDLKPLCELGTTYSVADTSGHNYSFNICGTSSFECVPSWTNVYETGVAVQYWGDPPACNATTPNCTDYRGNNVCCTQNCQVLGVGIPNWQLKVPADPEYGGLLVTHVGVPPR
jgi:hypothetical protein